MGPFKTQGRPADTHAHTRQTGTHPQKADRPTHAHKGQARPTDTHARVLSVLGYLGFLGLSWDT